MDDMNFTEYLLNEKTNTPKFYFSNEHGKWYATDSNTYDGAPDSDTKHHGVGTSKAESLQDLYDTLMDTNLYPHDVLKKSFDQAMKAYSK
jgi:hypothetical protein